MNFRLYNIDLLLFFSPVLKAARQKKMNEEKRSSVENGVRLSNA